MRMQNDLLRKGVKVLSLFFIDRVANYRDYDDAGQAIKGKFAEAFEATLAELGKDDRYRDLVGKTLPHPFVDREMVIVVGDRIKSMIEAGMTLEQVKAAKPTFDYDGLYGAAGDWTGDMFVDAIYRDVSGRGK